MLDSLIIVWICVSVLFVCAYVRNKFCHSSFQQLLFVVAWKFSNLPVWTWRIGFRVFFSLALSLFRHAIWWNSSLYEYDPSFLFIHTNFSLQFHSNYLWQVFEILTRILLFCMRHVLNWKCVNSHKSVYSHQCEIIINEVTDFLSVFFSKYKIISTKL